MANKFYKQTFNGRQSVQEVHDEIGRRGGLIVRIDQYDASVVAFYEAEAAPQPGDKDTHGKVEEVSLKDIIKMS